MNCHETNKLVVFDHPYEQYYEPLEPEPDNDYHLQEEVKVHHVGMNSPYMGDDLGDGDDFLVRPSSVDLLLSENEL